jgi:hypothetical protein
MRWKSYISGNGGTSLYSRTWDLVELLSPATSLAASRGYLISQSLESSRTSVGERRYASSKIFLPIGRQPSFDLGLPPSCHSRAALLE